LETADNQCLNSPDKSLKKTKSEFSRRSGIDLESPPAGTPLTDHVTDHVKPAGKGGAEGAEEEGKSLSESELGKAKSPTNNVLAGAPVETLESLPAGTPLTDHVTDQVKPAGKGGAEGAEKEKSLSELELGKAKSPTNNVLADAPVKSEEEKSLSESELGKAKSPTNNVLAGAPVEKEDRVGEEVYSVDEDTVEKRPYRTVKLRARYADFCMGTTAKQSSHEVSSGRLRTPRL